MTGTESPFLCESCGVPIRGGINAYGGDDACCIPCAASRSTEGRAVKAYRVEYRVTVVAYGRTATEAVTNGSVLFANGDSMSEPFVSEADGDADLYMATVARYVDSRPVGRTRRSPDDDAFIPAEEGD